MQHPDDRFFLARDRMASLEREARDEIARRHRRQAVPRTIDEPGRARIFLARLRRPAFLRLARG